MGARFARKEPARAVLFVDDAGWASFDQAAVSLKRRGIRTIRVVASEPARFGRMMSEPRLRWAADRLFYDQLICLGEPEGRARLAAMAEAGEIADVVVGEPSLVKVGIDTPEGLLLTSNSMAFRGTAPKVLLDKFKVNEILRDAGIGIPEQLSADACSPFEAVARLGLPLILKTPIGASGYGVRLVRTREELEPALADLRGGGQIPFYQAHIEGAVVMYAAVTGPDGAPLIEHGFKVERSQSELGPSAAVSLHDRPLLLDLGRRALQTFRPQGFAAFGFVEHVDGRLFHIDANIRVWGNIVSPLKLGIDYLDAYAALLRDQPWRPQAACEPAAGPMSVYPYALMEAVRSGTIRQMASQGSDFLQVCHGPLGSRYCAEAMGEAALLGVKRLLRPERAGERAPA